MCPRLSFVLCVSAASGRAVSFFAKVSSLFFSAATRDSSWASSIQCSATFSYALLMDGSVACVARRLASSAFRRQVSLSDDIRGGSSNAPNQEENGMRGVGWGHKRPPVPQWDGPGASLTATSCCAPKGHEKGECPFRLRLNSGAALQKG